VTARSDLARLVHAGEQDITRLYAGLGPALAASIARHAEDRVVTPTARLAILRDVDTAILPTVYPTERGAPSRLELQLRRRSVEAMLAPIATEVGRIRTRLPDDLLRRMGDR